MPRTFSPELEDWVAQEIQRRLPQSPAALSRELHAVAPESVAFEPFDRLVSRTLRRLRTAGEAYYCKNARVWRFTPLGLDAARAKCQLHARDSRRADL